MLLNIDLKNVSKFFYAVAAKEFLLLESIWLATSSTAPEMLLIDRLMSYIDVRIFIIFGNVLQMS